MIKQDSPQIAPVLGINLIQEFHEEIKRGLIELDATVALTVSIDHSNSLFLAEELSILSLDFVALLAEDVFCQLRGLY